MCLLEGRSNKMFSEILIMEISIFIPVSAVTLRRS